ncbi:M15 family metallopeptidase [Curtobacterium flaccumfaciens pv. oortii]|uniref:M15 family metallopeptidase n=1 Tax=Curtobacterium flaccumfaciens TaxID=2035 RepID=UPI001BDF2A61|nr:M15 family metallopeptidase [Curtobacterium flaccumfaciens]MBT1623487.1 M15 family metallopeptidase [Curtobacterium flaccumfaciens pv. oortii]
MADVDDVHPSARLEPPPAGASRRQVLMFAVATALAGSTVLSADRAFGATPDNLANLDKSKPEAGPSANARAAAVSGQWGGYQNGQIPTSVLEQVPALNGQPFLRPDAALAWRDLNADFTREFGTALVITEAYRDLARQEKLYQEYQAGTGPLAAEPGTSIHGWALACDFGSGVDDYDTLQKTWMDANAPTYGWQPTGNGFSQREAWHFEYDGSYAPQEPTPPAGTEQDASDMKLITNNGRTWLIGEMTGIEINSEFFTELKSTYNLSGSLGNLRAALVAQYGEPVAIQSATNVEGLLAVARRNRAVLVSEVK